MGSTGFPEKSFELVAPASGVVPLAPGAPAGPSGGAAALPAGLLPLPLPLPGTVGAACPATDDCVVLSVLRDLTWLAPPLQAPSARLVTPRIAKTKILRFAGTGLPHFVVCVV